jgi:hypothetical protein
LVLPQYFCHDADLKNELLDFSFDDEVAEGGDIAIDTEKAKELINKVADFTTHYKKRGKRSRKGSGNNLLSTRRYDSKRMNAEEEGSEGSSDENDLDDIFLDPSPVLKSSRSRKQSYTSMTN